MPRPKRRAKPLWPAPRLFPATATKCNLPACRSSAPCRWRRAWQQEGFSMATPQNDTTAAGQETRAATCMYLLSKGMFITGQRDLDSPAGGGQVGDGNCWCGRTQHVLGPDDKFVGRTKCVPGRTCYQPAL